MPVTAAVPIAVQSAVTLACSTSVEQSDSNNRGVFFDISNKSSSQLEVLSLVAGCYEGSTQAKLFAVRNGGRCAGNEQSESAWEEVWTGRLRPASTQCSLSLVATVAAGSTRGFLLHSTTGRCCYTGSNPGQVSDANVAIDGWLATDADTAFGTPQGTAYGFAGSLTYRLRQAGPGE